MQKKYIILPIILTFLSLLYSEEIGNLFYNGDIGELKDSTIIVSKKAVALSSKVKVLPPLSTVNDTIKVPSSIFFIIDHSGSMYQNPGNDVDGLRFTTSLEFIDSIKARFPRAEVGIAVFRQHLYFDPADSSYFEELIAYPQGAYMPFFKFDSSYVNNGGNSGLVVIQNILKTRNTGTYVDMEYIPTNVATNSPSTNINVGFAAARHAFQNALYANNRQFIIFLSDGDATEYNGPNTSDLDYVTDVDGLPTTFTIFFTSTGQVPPNLVTMTNNIQNSGYSPINPQSNIWAIQVDTLMQCLINNVMNIISGNFLSLPVDIIINEDTVSVYNSIDSTFTFGNHFPFTGDTSNFNYNVKYIVAKDSILPNGDSIVVQSDSSVNGNFAIVIKEGTNLPDHYPHDFVLSCWDRTIGFYYNNTPVTSVSKNMDTLEIRFTEKVVDVLYNYENVSVIITNSQGANIDIETFDLIKTDSCFTKAFPLAIDTNASPVNGILEVHERDSIIAIYKNQDLPLDTLWLTVPFNPTTAINPNSHCNQKTLSLNIMNSSILFNLPTSGKAKLQIYNIKGRLLSTLVDSYKQAGKHTITWDSKRYGSGVYYLKLTAGSDTHIRKAIVLK